mmetsp:Transcript_123934/g.321927  ORF Transcript_123934/g.321927 Transcript_123934/m.321927 type:complete len:233 (+) Transcript_123934:1052-1750(+)
MAQMDAVLQRQGRRRTTASAIATAIAASRAHWDNSGQGCGGCNFAEARRSQGRFFFHRKVHIAFLRGLRPYELHEIGPALAENDIALSFEILPFTVLLCPWLPVDNLSSLLLALPRFSLLLLLLVVLLLLVLLLLLLVLLLVYPMLLSKPCALLFGCSCLLLRLLLGLPCRNALASWWFPFLSLRFSPPLLPLLLFFHMIPPLVPFLLILHIFHVVLVRQRLFYKSYEEVDL